MGNIAPRGGVVDPASPESISTEGHLHLVTFTSLHPATTDTMHASLASCAATGSGSGSLPPSYPLALLLHIRTYALLLITDYTLKYLFNDFSNYGQLSF